MALSVSCFRTLKCQIIANRFKPAPLERMRDYSRLFIPLVEDKHLNWWGAGWLVLSEAAFTRIWIFYFFFNFYKRSLFYTVWPFIRTQTDFALSINVVFVCFMACASSFLCSVFSCSASMNLSSRTFYMSLDKYTPTLCSEASEGFFYFFFAFYQLNVQSKIQK